MADSVISLEYKGRVAVITIDNEKKLNALNQQQYYDIGQKLREVATHDEVYVTVLLAKGRFFSAYATTPLLLPLPPCPLAPSLHTRPRQYVLCWTVWVAQYSTVQYSAVILTDVIS